MKPLSKNSYGLYSSHRLIICHILFYLFIGYEGTLCQTEIDNCKTNPCGNNSISCTSGLNTFNCTCKPGWQGKGVSEKLPLTV